MARRVRAIRIAGFALAAGIVASQIGVRATQSGHASQTSQTTQVATPTVQTQSQPTPAPEPPKGTGLLFGQVVDASSNAPISAAVVTLSGGPTALPGSPPPLPMEFGGPTSSNRQVLADSSGRFVFHSLAAGFYTVTAMAPSYSSGSFGVVRPGGAGQSIVLTRDDEKRDGLVLRMWKSASLSGTVLDEAGEPVIGYTVRTFMRSLSGGRARWLNYSTAVTDDRGVYRIASLQPGEYVVGSLTSTTTMPSAVVDAFRQEIESGSSSLNGPLYRELSASGISIGTALSGSYRVGDLVMQTGMSGRGGSGALPPPPPDANRRLMVYASQFHPAAPNLAQATIITLASGDDRRGIDLRLKLVPSVRVSGTVIGPNGPAANLGVRLLPPGSEDFTSESGVEAATTTTDASGAFTFLGVTPGTYTLKAIRVPRPLPQTRVEPGLNMVEISGPNGMMMGFSSGSGVMPPTPPLPPEPTLYFVQPLTVGEADLQGVSVTLRTGARLSGRVVFEGDAPPPEEIQRTQLSISPLGGALIPQVSSAPKRVEGDGQFATVGFPPGRYSITASMPVLTAPYISVWRFKSATLSGRDLSDEGFEVAGQDLTSFVVTLTTQSLAEITGTVKNERGENDLGASVVILPSDSDAWKRGIITTRRIRSARVSTSGMYRFADVPPGTYFIAAVSDTQLHNYQNPGTLEAISRVATQITVGASGSVTQALTTRTIK